VNGVLLAAKFANDVGRAAQWLPERVHNLDSQADIFGMF
jgi:hypothetical protein